MPSRLTPTKSWASPSFIFIKNGLELTLFIGAQWISSAIKNRPASAPDCDKDNANPNGKKNRRAEPQQIRGGFQSRPEKDEVTVEMVEKLTVAGDPMECLERLRACGEHGVSYPIVCLPPKQPWPMQEMFLRALAPNQ
jgi:hypothetical protein